MRSAVFFGLAASAVILAAMSVRDARQSGTDLTKRSDRSVAAASQGTQRHLAARTGQEADTLREPPAAHRQGSPHLASPYYTNQIIVAPARGQSLAGVARHLGGTIERTPGRSGYGVIRLPEGTSVADAIGQVQAAGLIDGAAPNGRMVGAGKPKTPPLRGPQRFQWHRKAARMRARQQDAPVADLSEWVVAVLDTGVAYEQYADDDHTYVPAGSLSGSPIVAPYDFVNDDAHANDDHQHGTHIASVIASSDDGAVLGQVEGMAPGASLMPIKVLDDNNVGSEFALMEAIYHAVDNEADVINMSLSFHPDYVPSVALNEALEAASRAGILMVAASGNDGLGAATWPAASPLVVGVGSAAPTNDKNELVAAHYSNLAPSIDIVAPGGSLDADLNEDGQIDGILGQTIRLNHPEEMGYWFYAGTSQAAAVVSGALVQLLEAGATPKMARNALLLGAVDDCGPRWSSGTGAGSLDLDESLKLIEDGDEALLYEGRLHVAVLPVLYAKSESEVMPVASVTVLDDDGLPVKDITAWVAFTGSVDQMASCKTNEVGWCYATASEIEWLNTDTMEATPVGVAVEVSTVTTRAGIPVHPTPLTYVQGEMEVVLAGMAAEPSLDGAALTIHWTPTESDRILQKIAGAYTVMSTGTGLASSPLGMVFNEAAIGSFASVDTVDVDLDGTGLASSPLGFLTIDRLTFDGTGLASSPLGLIGMRLAAFDGTGLASSPLGLTAWHMVMTIDALDGSGLASSPLGFEMPRRPVMVDLDGTGLASSPLGLQDLAGTHIGNYLAGGGAITGTGHPLAEALRASGVAGVEALPLVLDPVGQGSAEADPDEILE